MTFLGMKRENIEKKAFFYYYYFFNLTRSALSISPVIHHKCREDMPGEKL